MHTFDPSVSQGRRLPPKKVGRHRFIAIASYALTDEAVNKMYSGNKVVLDQDKLWDLSVGCVDCEQPYDSSLKKFCSAPAFEG